jgi:hypothetical protein
MTPALGGEHGWSSIDNRPNEVFARPKGRKKKMRPERDRPGVGHRAESNNELGNAQSREYHQQCNEEA